MEQFALRRQNCSDVYQLTKREFFSNPGFELKHRHSGQFLFEG